MLAKQGIVSEEDRKAIIDGLNSILADIESGNWYLPKNTRISIPSLRRTLSNGSEMPERDSTPGEAEMIRSLSI